MDISDYTVEDFILDQEFKIWIYSPTVASNAYWSKIFEENPAQINNALLAKEILLNLDLAGYELDEKDSEALWQKIDSEIEKFAMEDAHKIKPIHGNLMKESGENRVLNSKKSWFNPVFRIAALLVLMVLLSFLARDLFFDQDLPKSVTLPKNESRTVTTPPGVKSSLTMSDGTKVLINSGSTLRFLKNFESNKREVYLDGEAYFEVAKDSLRPFSVITGPVTTTALGTSFNISAYPSEQISVALVEGLVEVDAHQKDTNRVFLQKGELVSVNNESGKIRKQQFDSELVLAWTNKKIIFQGVHLAEALRILENWYGVKFFIDSKPTREITIYGVFQDETLENVLENISYTAGFNYKINKDEVNLIFN